MPETSVDENGDHQAGPSEVRLSVSRPLLAVASQSGRPQDWPSASSVVRFPFDRTVAMIFDLTSLDTWSISTLPRPSAPGIRF
jgi:hypothetical protein